MRPTIATALMLITGISLVGGLLAQTTSAIHQQFAPSASDDVLTNAAILQLVKTGIGDEVLVVMVNLQPGSYSLGPDSVIALKHGGVSDAVIAAMLNRAKVQRSGVPKADSPICTPLPATGDAITGDQCIESELGCAGLNSDRGLCSLATITTLHSTITFGSAPPSSLADAFTEVTAWYSDSKKMDIAVTVEFSDHTTRRYEYRDLPLVSGAFANAATARGLTMPIMAEIISVEAMEKGGVKEASHFFKFHQ